MKIVIARRLKKKLKRLGVLSKFKRNSSRRPIFKHSMLIGDKRFTKKVWAGFDWCDSFESSDFWVKVAMEC